VPNGALSRSSVRRNQSTSSLEEGRESCSLRIFRGVRSRPRRRLSAGSTSAKYTSERSPRNDDIEAGVAETLARAGVAESDAAEATETGASSKTKRKPSNRAPLPDHLPAE